MKLQTKRLSYDEVMALPRPKRENPMKPSMFFRTLIRVLSIPTLMKTHFSYTAERMELAKDKPCLILMNHSSFTDLKVAYKIFYPRPMNIVVTDDGVIGKPWLMRWIGSVT